VSSQSRRIVARTRRYPPAEHPRGFWLVSISGVFLDIREKFRGDPYGQAEPFSQELDNVVDWRSTSETDRERLKEWHDDFSAFHTEGESDSVINADSVLSPRGPSLLEDQGDSQPIVDAFIIALSLHTSAQINAQMLRFEIEESPEDEESIIPHSGGRVFHSVRLPGWNLQQPITRDLIAEVVNTYPDVKRVRAQPAEHGMMRSLSAYRAATSLQGFIDAIPILACASLEALTATRRWEDVIARVVPRYAPEKVRPSLEALYQLRHWFAHGMNVPDMSKSEVRLRTVDDGLLAVKGVLRSAVADPDLFAAASSGVKAVKAFLDNP
jgi:hypothetical protein